MILLIDLWRGLPWQRYLFSCSKSGISLFIPNKSVSLAFPIKVVVANDSRFKYKAKFEGQI